MVRCLPLILLQRSAAMQVRSSVRLIPHNQPSSKDLLPSPTAWSPDQRHTVMLADVSQHILGRTEGRGLGFGQLVRTDTGKCLKCQSSSDGHSDQAEDGSLLGLCQSPDWVKGRRDTGVGPCSPSLLPPPPPASCTRDWNTGTHDAILLDTWWSMMLSCWIPGDPWCYPAGYLVIHDAILLDTWWSMMLSCWIPGDPWCYPAGYLVFHDAILLDTWCSMMLPCRIPGVPGYLALHDAILPDTWYSMMLSCHIPGVPWCYPARYLVFQDTWHSMMSPCWIPGVPWCYSAGYLAFHDAILLDTWCSMMLSCQIPGIPWCHPADTWHFRVSTWTGWPGGWPGEIASLTNIFYLSVAGRRFVWADSFLRHTGMLLGQ